MVTVSNPIRMSGWFEKASFYGNGAAGAVKDCVSAITNSPSNGITKGEQLAASGCGTITENVLKAMVAPLLILPVACGSSEETGKALASPSVVYNNNSSNVMSNPLLTNLFYPGTLHQTAAVTVNNPSNVVVVFGVGSAPITERENLPAFVRNDNMIKTISQTYGNVVLPIYLDLKIGSVFTSVNNAADYLWNEKLPTDERYIATLQQMSASLMQAYDGGKNPSAFEPMQYINNILNRLK